MFMFGYELKNLIKSEDTLIMPDAYDAISAKLIENAGFKAVQCSGYSFSIAAGYKCENDVTLNENLEWTRRIVESVNLPVMADAEDGYGGMKQVVETVGKFIDIGVAGLNIEDQVHDKRSTLSIIDADSMVQKIIAVRETAEIKDKPDFVINGRTDALRSTSDRSKGLEIAIKRANKYLEAGADLSFITYVETLDEVKTIVKEVNGSVSIAAGMPYNINNFTIDDLKQCGVARISLPTLLVLSSLQGITNSLKYLNNDILIEMADNSLLYDVNDLNRLLK